MKSFVPSQKIGEKIHLIKIPPQQKLEFSFDSSNQQESHEWIRDLLKEMNEHASEKKADDYLKETHLVFSGEMMKKDKVDLGEILVVKGTLEGLYATECVRTLSPMKIDFHRQIKVVFIDKSLSQTDEFSDLDETYVDDDLYEIYFFEKRMVDLKEMVHEQIFLHYEPYPILDAESKLDLL